jgi:TrmH family RNA methyltransferase
MANFDFEKLFLVKPCKLDDECYARAMHASNILDNAKAFSSFKQATEKMDFLVATSSIESSNDKRHLRNAVEINSFSEKIYKIKGKIGLVFGREDYGLLNEEIAKCDMMLRIPTSEKYLSLNLSHAVCIVLNSLYFNKNNKHERRIIDKIEKEKLYSFFSQILDEIDYPKHKRENTEVMFKRLMGRSIPSKWEYHTLMGVFSKTLDKMKRQK